jgi:RecB family exonuclease
VPEPGPDRPILGGGLRLSPSQADSYVTCPRKYALERRLRLGDTFSPYAALGTLVHAALEATERENIGSGRPHADLEDALAHLERVWAEADFGTPQLNEAWLAQARQALVKLYDAWPSDGLPAELEKKVVTEVGGVEWVGYIDRLERNAAGLRVVDYKTSKTAPSLEESKRSVQLGFYAAAVEDELGEPVVNAEMWFPRVKSKSVTTRSFDMTLLPEVRQTMEDIASAILEERWEPRVSDRCKTCEFRRSCPAWAEGKGAYLP